MEFDPLQIIQLLLIGISQGCFYGLIALGFVLIYKATEMINFAQGDMMMLGMFMGITVTVGMGLPFWSAIPICMLAMGVFGYLMDVLIFRRVIGQPAFVIVVLTISLGFIMRAAAGMIWGAQPLALPSPLVGNIELGGLVITIERVAVIIGTIIVTSLLYAFFRFTRVGVAMQASSQNQLAAYYMGIPVKRIFSLIWFISAAVAALAGLLVAPVVTTVTTDIGLAVTIKAFAGAVIGGFGSLPGAILGCLIIGIVEPFAGAYLPEFKEIIAFVILFVVLVLRPQGLFAQIQRKKV
ncbi:MAG: branched-chain amino acid ABC transporter permease [Oleiphilus sp.]|nr:MAG: branched-chain amino acid ABC transporter permease [Oleiphilus sp.]